MLLTIKIQRHRWKRCSYLKEENLTRKYDKKKNCIDNLKILHITKHYISFALRKFYSTLLKNTIAMWSTWQHPIQKEVSQGSWSYTSGLRSGCITNKRWKDRNTKGRICHHTNLLESDTAKWHSFYLGKENWDPGYSSSFVTSSTWPRGHAVFRPSFF